MSKPLPLHRALGIDRRLDRPTLLATVGGGGKTTLLFALAAEAAADREAAADLTILTTTTKMTLSPAAAEMPLILGANEASRAAAIDDVYRRGLSAAVVGSGRGDRERIRGVDPAWPRRALNLPGVGLVAVEADGSAGRPFKAPAEHEPVIPDNVDIVAAVVGAQAIGAPLDERRVHRPERVRALLDACGSNAEPCQEITPDMIAAVLAHPNGGRKHVPDTAEYVVVIANASRHARAAQAIAAACHAAGLTRIIAFDPADPTPRTL